jgi:formate--tetrahydrofolate ligase
MREPRCRGTRGDCARHDDANRTGNRAAGHAEADNRNNSLFRGNEFGLDLNQITWKRVLDVNDRALRNIVIGLGAAGDGVPRQAGFAITAASEVMAVLAFARYLRDLRARLGRIVVGYTQSGEPVTAEQLKAAGAAAVIMREALKPNLLGATPASTAWRPADRCPRGCWPRTPRTC